MIDEILAEENIHPVTQASDVLWSLGDHIGSIRDVVRYNPATNTPQVANHLFYDGFGNIVSESDVNLEHRFAFTGREWDEEIDLQYNRARYYDPKIGRWISKDPLGFDAGDMNLYRYVGNGPTDASDPSGLEETFFDKLRKRDEEIRYLASPHSGSLQHESSERVKAKIQTAKNFDEVLEPLRAINDATTIAAGARSGARNGLVVELDALTTYQIESLHDKSLRLQEEAIQRGDVLTQIGYGSGKFGAHTLDAAGAVVVITVAAEGSAAALIRYGGETGATIVSTSSATLSSSYVPIPVTGALADVAYHKGKVSYYAAKEGDYIIATNAAGSTANDLIFAGSVVRNSLQLNRTESLFRNPYNWPNNSLQTAVDKIQTQLPQGYTQLKSPTTLSVSPEGQIVLSRLKQVPSQQQIAAAEDIFGQGGVINVRDTTRTNGTGPTADHAEMRNAEYFRANNLSTQVVKQASSHYACRKGCEAAQAEAGINNITGFESVHGKIARPLNPNFVHPIVPIRNAAAVGTKQAVAGGVANIQNNP